MIMKQSYTTETTSIEFLFLLIFFFTEGIEPGLTSKNEINPKDYFSPY